MEGSDGVEGRRWGALLARDHSNFLHLPQPCLSFTNTITFLNYGFSPLTKYSMHKNKMFVETDSENLLNGGKIMFFYQWQGNNMLHKKNIINFY